MGASWLCHFDDDELLYPLPGITRLADVFAEGSLASTSASGSTLASSDAAPGAAPGSRPPGARPPGERGSSSSSLSSSSLAGVAPHVWNLRFDNLEVCKRTHLDDSAYNYFVHERAFKLRVGAHADNKPLKAATADARFFVAGVSGAAAAKVTAPFLSYFNGKSAGRLGEQSVRPCGVHHFASDAGHPKVRSDVSHKDLVS